jgi:hypothetical protein
MMRSPAILLAAGMFVIFRSEWKPGPTYRRRRRSSDFLAVRKELQNVSPCSLLAWRLGLGRGQKSKSLIGWNGLYR